MTSSIKPEVRSTSEEDRATAIGNMHKNFGEDRTRSSEDMIADSTRAGFKGGGRDPRPLPPKDGLPPNRSYFISR